MRVLNRILICGGVLCLAASAQQPPPIPGLVVPKQRRLPGAPAVEEAAPAMAASLSPCEVLINNGTYKTCREGAVAALRAGNDAANNVRPNRDRAVGFYLLSIQRDPSYARALFNLGVMCVKSVPERWQDALNFYHEAAHLDSSPDLSALLSKELPRVEAISRLESTADGQRQRKFDLDLNDLMAKINDPAIAIGTAERLVKSDAGRWEAPAIVGIVQAELTHYAESAASLEAAARLAPADWRAKISSAAELAKNEAQYVKALQEGDAAFEKKDYENAGRLYADAWQASPGRLNTGMQAAISFLMADRVSLAVQLLSRIRQLKNPELSEKAGGMLRELAAISPDAKAAADAQSSGDVEPVFDVAERIRTLIGDPRNAEMKLVTSPPPAVIGDDLKFIQTNDDEINHPKEEYVTTSESVFGIYLKRVGDRRVSPQDNPTVISDSPVADTPAAPIVSRPPSFGSRTDPGASQNGPPDLTLPVSH